MITPEDLQNKPLSEEELDDMPEPKVKKYQKVCVLTEKFKEVINGTLGTLGYAQIIGVPQQHFQVSQLFKRIEELNYRIPVQEMNNIISLIALAPYNVVKPFMELVENPQLQTTLWTIEEE